MTMPNSTVPAPPMPTQTAYAGPIGDTSLAFARNSTLAINATMVSAAGRGRVEPVLAFRPIAQPISTRPATNNITQAEFMGVSMMARVVPLDLMSYSGRPGATAIHFEDSTAGVRRDRHDLMSGL